MKAVNVDDVLKILHKYGKYIFVTDMKKYSSMVDEIANLKPLGWAYESGADYWREIEDVEAWMPLPKRYEPEAEGSDSDECETKIEKA